jgi:hypothetical protein
MMLVVVVKVVMSDGVAKNYAKHSATSGKEGARPLYVSLDSC